MQTFTSAILAMILTADSTPVEYATAPPQRKYVLQAPPDEYVRTGILMKRVPALHSYFRISCSSLRCARVSVKSYMVCTLSPAASHAAPIDNNDWRA